jgi:CheY-like chemotaxis protein
MAKILLVEDDKSLREIYGVRLMAEGYEIVSAGDGEEALAMAIKERPNLIVSDVMMPKISGFDMLDILRSTTETKDVKVIMMTALSSDDQRARGEKLGADRYLVKSQVGIEDVVRTVHDVLGDGVPGAAPAPTNFPSTTPTVPTAPAAPVPVAPVTPDPVPAAVPAPLPDPVVLSPAPISEPPMSTPAPVAPFPEPTAPPVINLPPTPAPVPDPVPAPMPAPVAEPVVPAPAPVAPTPEPVVPPAPEPFKLPEPTAPFSSPRPASLGDRVINPINSINMAAPTDIAAQMNQELNGPTQPPTPPVPPQPPVPPMPGV